MERSNLSFKKADKHKAIDQLIWLSFSHRNDNQSFKLVETRTFDFSIEPSEFEHWGWGLSVIKRIRKHYKRMTYSEIREIASDNEALEHWEAIRGMISVQDGDILRFILKYQIPLEKFIRYELASRGFDENHQWCGFKKAESIWLK